MIYYKKNLFIEKISSNDFSEMSSFIIGRFNIIIVNYNIYNNYHLPRKYSIKYKKSRFNGNTPYLRIGYRNSSASENINIIDDLVLNDSLNNSTINTIKVSHSEVCLKSKDCNNIDNNNNESQDSHNSDKSDSKNSNSSYIPSSDEFLPLDQDTYQYNDDSLLNIQTNIKPSSMSDLKDVSINNRNKYISPSSYTSVLFSPNTISSPTTNQTTANNSFISDVSNDSSKLGKDSNPSTISNISLLNNQKNNANKLSLNPELIKQIPDSTNNTNISRDNIYSLSHINTPSCFPVSPSAYQKQRQFTPTIQPMNNYNQQNFQYNHHFTPNIFSSPTQNNQQHMNQETNKSPPQIVTPNNIPFNKLDFTTSSSFTTPNYYNSSFNPNKELFSNIYNEHNPFVYYISPLSYSSDYLNLDPNIQSYIEHFISIQNDFNNYLIFRKLYKLNPVLVDLFSKNQAVDNLQNELFKLNEYIKMLKEENNMLHQEIERKNKKE